jgi:hypothetical protein
MQPAVTFSDFDPFDLPDWLGEGEVVWTPDHGLGREALVRGRLASTAPAEELACDLLAVDEAYPAPVADDATRTRAHQSWRHGQALLLTVEGRLTVAVPGRRLTADLVLTCLSRLARAVAADPERYAAVLRVSRDETRQTHTAG